MAIIFDNPVTAGTVLVRSAIQSPGFLTGVSGWTVNIDGSAEFNNLLLRGTFLGTDYIMNAAGAFFYSSAPAAGNLVASIASGAGTDAFGNGYLGGLSTYDNAGGAVVNIQGNTLSYGTIVGGVPTLTGAATLTGAGAVALMGSGVTAALPQAMSLELDAGVANALPQPTSPRATFHSSSTSPVLVQAQGAFVAMDPAQLPNLEPYVWQPTSGAVNWSVGDFAGTYGALQFRIDNEDNVRAIGAMHMVLAAGLAAGTYTILNAAIPAAYRPAKNWRVTAIHMSSANVTKAVALFTLTTAGVFQVSTSTAIAQNDNFYLDGCFPLGNIA